MVECFCGASAFVLTGLEGDGCCGVEGTSRCSRVQKWKLQREVQVAGEEFVALINFWSFGLFCGFLCNALAFNGILLRFLCPFLLWLFLLRFFWLFLLRFLRLRFLCFFLLRFLRLRYLWPFLLRFLRLQFLWVFLLRFLRLRYLWPFLLRYLFFWRFLLH